MTIARDFTAQPGSYGDEGGATRWQDGTRHAPPVGPDFLVPVEVREERLSAQLRSFERAGYRVETRAGLQAIVAKPRERRRVRDAAIAVGTLGLALIPTAWGARRKYHRVIVTIDPIGAVRLA